VVLRKVDVETIENLKLFVYLPAAHAG